MYSLNLLIHIFDHLYSNFKFLKSRTHSLNLLMSTLNEMSVGFPSLSISVFNTLRRFFQAS